MYLSPSHVPGTQMVLNKWTPFSFFFFLLMHRIHRKTEFSMNLRIMTKRKDKFPWKKWINHWICSRRLFLWWKWSRTKKTSKVPFFYKILWFYHLSTKEIIKNLCVDNNLLVLTLLKTAHWIQRKWIFFKTKIYYWSVQFKKTHPQMTAAPWEEVTLVQEKEHWIHKGLHSSVRN